MNQHRPFFEIRYPKRYIFTISLYIWFVEISLFLIYLGLFSLSGQGELGIIRFLQTMVVLWGIYCGLATILYYSSKLKLTEHGLVQDWLWGFISTEISWQNVIYHRRRKLPGLHYDILRDQDDPTLIKHIDVPIDLEHYEIFSRHLEERGINLEYGQVLRLDWPPQPIVDLLHETYPQTILPPNRQP
ncbi:MAG: hypothetical protein AB1489_04070 [Acidobacteriota bacterium]